MIVNMLLLFNTLCWIVFGTIYFKKNYKIVDIETYQALMECAEEVARQTNEEEVPELPGGSGFFREYIEEEEEEEE